MDCKNIHLVIWDTCLNPGTSPTAVPSARTQMTSGAGDPRAAHSTTAPVVLLKSTRFGGSFMKIGPIVSSSHRTAPVNDTLDVFNKIYVSFNYN